LRESFISFKCLRPALLTAAKTTHERGLDDSGNLRCEPPANQEKRKKTKNVVIDRICDVQLFSFPLDNGQSTLYFLDYSKRVSLVAMATYTNVEIVSFISQVRYTDYRERQSRVSYGRFIIPAQIFIYKVFFHFYFCVQLEIAQRARCHVRKKKKKEKTVGR
jgi:hypothetical protein